MDSSPLTIDRIFIILANAINLLFAAMFMARAFHRRRLARGAGTTLLISGIPLTALVIYNLVTLRGIWMVLLPAVLVLHFAVEWIYDYVLKINFRNSWLLWPYLLLFYAGQIGLIGYAFLVQETFGFFTLTTYFISLGATWFSYARVGHGVGMGRARSAALQPTTTLPDAIERKQP